MTVFEVLKTIRGENMGRTRQGEENESAQNYKLVLTYKCLALNNLSRPGVVPFETGMDPCSLLSDRSIKVRLDRLPMEGGIGPLKLLFFRDLQ